MASHCARPLHPCTTTKELNHEFAIDTNLRDSNGVPIDGEIQFVAGLCDYDPAATLMLRVGLATADCFLGRVIYPGSGDFRFSGNLAALKLAIKRAASAYEFMQHPRFDFERD